MGVVRISARSLAAAQVFAATYGAPAITRDENTPGEGQMSNKESPSIKRLQRKLAEVRAHADKYDHEATSSARVDLLTDALRAIRRGCHNPRSIAAIALEAASSATPGWP